MGRRDDLKTACSRHGCSFPSREYSGNRCGPQIQRSRGRGRLITRLIINSHFMRRLFSPANRNESPRIAAQHPHPISLSALLILLSTLLPPLGARRPQDKHPVPQVTDTHNFFNMFRTNSLTVATLSLFSLAARVAASPCAVFDANFNLLVFGLDGKDWNAGTQDSWGSGEGQKCL
jgi:hypothetical protein